MQTETGILASLIECQVHSEQGQTVARQGLARRCPGHSSRSLLDDRLRRRRDRRQDASPAAGLIGFTTNPGHGSRNALEPRPLPVIRVMITVLNRLAEASVEFDVQEAGRGLGLVVQPGPVSVLVIERAVAVAVLRNVEV